MVGLLCHAVLEGVVFANAPEATGFRPLEAVVVVRVREGWMALRE
jgi:hypothetical protein